MPDRLENAPCGFVEFNDDGQVIAANETLTRWLDEPTGSLVGRKFESLLTVANRIFFQTHFFPLLRLQGKTEEIFLALRARDGTSVPVITSAQREVGPAGAVSSCIFLTVHQRRKYEDEILQAKHAAEEAVRNNEELQAAKGDLEERARELERRMRQIILHNLDLERVAQILSHDLREPIRKVGLFADLVRNQRDAALNAEAAGALDKIDRESARMESLIRAMQEFLRPQAAGPAEKLDLKDLIEQAAAAVALKMGGDWLFECERLPEVEGRASDLELLFCHLIENAVKFRSPDRRLRIKVRGHVIQQNVYEATTERYHYADFALVEVHDNGIGFDPKYRDYVFQLLKKVELTSPGLGVGLALCRKIAAAHHGSIQADPKPGVGTTITVLLPVIR
ncbi:MAG TPA: PAS domain-containing sensor histidine kinase [Opitutaceae bacterium]|nr:PAS domain-containing sensor histidine kinase [Opitutaceae bacterium]